jgi:internalin A
MLTIKFISGVNFNFISELYNLEDLKLYTCGITNINFLKNLNNIKQLNLTDNLISDISSLKNLINIEHLFLGGNKQIRFIPLFPNLKIIEIDFTSVKSIKTLYNIDFKYQKIHAKLKVLTKRNKYYIKLHQEIKK